MNLQPTYYDFVRRLRPFVVELAELDAKDLLTPTGTAQTIHSVDDYGSVRYKQCLDQLLDGMMNEFATRSGLPAEDFKKYVKDAPAQVKTHIASLAHTVNYEYHSFVNFALSGKKTFHFSDNLSEHLANTEINIKTDLVGLPFASCLFVFTSSMVINAMHNIRGKEGRWDINTAELDYSAPVSVFLTMHPKDQDLPGRKLVITAWHAKQPNHNYLALKRELYMGEEWTLEQALRTDWDKLNPENRGKGISIATGTGVENQDDSTFYTDGLGFYRIILNAILYLSSDEPELLAMKSPRMELEAIAEKILSAPKRKKVKKEAYQHSILDYSEVGASVGTIIVQRGETRNECDRTGESKIKPLLRFMVRGHWRHQPCGTGLTERKLIWIRPFYKGSDMASHVNKPYLVK